MQTAQGTRWSYLFHSLITQFPPSHLIWKNIPPLDFLHLHLPGPRGLHRTEEVSPASLSPGEKDRSLLSLLFLVLLCLPRGAPTENRPCRDGWMTLHGGRGVWSHRLQPDARAAVRTHSRVTAGCKHAGCNRYDQTRRPPFAGLHAACAAPAWAPGCSALAQAAP